MSTPVDHNGSTLLTRADAVTDFIAPYDAGADGLVIWGDAGGNPKSLSCMCDPQHNGPSKPSYFDNIKQQTGALQTVSSVPFVAKFVAPDLFLVWYMKGPLIKDYLAKIVECSTQHCSGHGRCNTVHLHGAPAHGAPTQQQVGTSTCTCYDGYSGDKCKERA